MKPVKLLSSAESALYQETPSSLAVSIGGRGVEVTRTAPVTVACGYDFALVPPLDLIGLDLFSLTSHRVTTSRVNCAFYLRLKTFASPRAPPPQSAHGSAAP